MMPYTPSFKPRTLLSRLPGSGLTRRASMQRSAPLRVARALLLLLSAWAQSLGFFGLSGVGGASLRIAYRSAYAFLDKKKVKYMPQLNYIRSVSFLHTFCGVILESNMHARSRRFGTQKPTACFGCLGF